MTSLIMRYIINNVLLIEKLWTRQGTLISLLISLKLDFAKTYDKVGWEVMFNECYGGNGIVRKFMEMVMMLYFKGTKVAI
jgi:hypothetical protein